MFLLRTCVLPVGTKTFTFYVHEDIWYPGGGGWGAWPESPRDPLEQVLPLSERPKLQGPIPDELQ